VAIRPPEAKSSSEWSLLFGVIGSGLRRTGRFGFGLPAAPGGDILAAAGAGGATWAKRGATNGGFRPPPALPEDATRGPRNAEPLLPVQEISKLNPTPFASGFLGFCRKPLHATTPHMQRAQERTACLDLERQRPATGPASQIDIQRKIGQDFRFYCADSLASFPRLPCGCAAVVHNRK